MHSIHNVLYEIKKESLKRSSPMFEPNHEQDDLREELARLRTVLRNKDTQIIRMQGQIDEMKKKITLFEFNSKASTQKQEESQQQQMSAFSEIPMIFENKELKQNNQALHSQNLVLNGRNNELEAELRQVKSDAKRLQTRLKQLEILEKMRQQRFKDQLEKLTPIIIEQNKDFTFVKEGVLKLVHFLRENVINLVFDIFLRCAKECEKEKKVSSFTIFKHYWLDLKSSRSLGFLSVVKVYQAVKKLTRMLSQQYAQLREQQYRDTMNDWIINTLVDIKHTNSKQEEQKLFRLLGLLYRSKFPIKNQQFQLNEDVKEYFQDIICQEVCAQLTSP